MSREKKIEIIDSLQDIFSRCSILILTDYRGLNTSEMTDLRRKLQASGSEYRVVKNTLARFAAERASKEALVSAFEGPIAIAFSYGDIMSPAKVLAGYIADPNSTLSIKGGLLDDRLLTPVEVTTLSTLPTREILIGRVLGQMKSPISALLGCLNSPIRGFIGVIQSRIKQLEGE